MHLSCRVKDFMTTQLITFNEQMDVMEAVRIMVENGISGGPVVDQHGQLKGIITEKDCLKIVLNAGYYDDWGGQVSEYMQENVICIEDNMTITDLAEKLISEPYRRYPVVKDGNLVGQVSRHDVLRTLIALTR